MDAHGWRCLPGQRVERFPQNGTCTEADADGVVVFMPRKEPYENTHAAAHSLQRGIDVSANLSRGTYATYPLQQAMPPDTAGHDTSSRSMALQGDASRAEAARQAQCAEKANVSCAKAIDM